MELSNKISIYANTLKIPMQEKKYLLDELEKKDWLSDQRFTDQFVFSKKRKFGLRKIAHELKIKGIDEVLISKTIKLIKPEEFILAKKIWEKKYHKLPSTINEKTKQIRFLQGRGIEMSIILKILSGKLPEIL